MYTLIVGFFFVGVGGSMNHSVRKRQRMTQDEGNEVYNRDEDALQEAAIQTLAHLSRDINQEVLMDEERAKAEDAQREAKEEARQKVANEGNEKNEEKEGGDQEPPFQVSPQVQHSWLMAPKVEKHTRVGTDFQALELPLCQPKPNLTSSSSSSVEKET